MYRALFELGQVHNLRNFPQAFPWIHNVGHSKNTMLNCSSGAPAQAHPFTKIQKKSPKIHPTEATKTTQKSPPKRPHPHHPFKLRCGTPSEVNMLCERWISWIRWSRWRVASGRASLTHFVGAIFVLVEGKPHAQEWGRMVEKDGFLWVICVCWNDVKIRVKLNLIFYIKE